MEVKPPALAHQPRNRITRAKDAQIIARAVAHDVLRPAAIQRMRAGPKTVNRRATVLKEHLVALKGQILNAAALPVPDTHAQRSRLDVNGVLSPSYLARLSRLVSALAVKRRRIPA